MNKYSVKFYRAKQSNDGCACIVEYNEGSDAAWLSFYPQTGEKDFDWSKDGGKLVAKLNATELGLIVGVCNNLIEGLGKKGDKGWSGLIHKSNDGQDSAVISLSPAASGDPATRFLSLSKTSGGAQRRMSVALGTGDLQNLRILCERAMFDMMLQEAYQGGNGESQSAPAASKPAAKPSPAKPAANKPVAKKPTPQPAEQEDEESVPL